MGASLVNLDWYGDPAPFYCPVCGKVIFDEGSDGVFCEHVIFAFLPEYEGLDPVPDHILKAAREQAKEKFIAKYKEELGSDMDYLSELDFDDLVELLSNAIESPSTFMMTLTTSGFACGPCSTTVIVAVDFNPEKRTVDCCKLVNGKTTSSIFR